MHIIHTSLRDPSTEGNGGAATGANPFAPSNNDTSTSQSQQQQSGNVVQQSAVPTQRTADTGSQQGGSGQSTQQSTTPVQQTQQSAQQTSPQLIGMSPEQLQQLAASLRQPTDAAQQGQPQMSEADFKKAFNIHEATEQDFEATFGVKPTPAQLAKYNDHLQAVSRQSVTIMRYLMDQRMKEVQQQFQPVQQTIQQQTEQRYYNEFVGEYPGLKDYGPLLKEIVDAARARGMQFPDASAAKQFVAAQAAKLLGKQVTDFTVAQAAQGQQNQTSQQSGSRTMSTTSMGGRSGASGGAAPTQTTAERLFQ